MSQGNDIRYGVHVTSYRGGPVSGMTIHFYARAWRYDRSKDWDDDERLVEHEAKLVLSAAGARALNKKDNDSWLGSMGLTYKAGDECNRFDTEEDALAAGVKIVRDTWGADVTIEIGDHISLENATVPCQYRTTVSDCDCPAFRYRRGPCKHIKALRAAVALVRAAGYLIYENTEDRRNWTHERDRR